MNREYVIYIPQADRDLRKDYDPNHPYMLVLSMHCMGANDAMQAADSFFQEIHTSDSTKIPCIFVAPQGYTDGSPWRGGDDKDHIFVDDMLKLFKSQLCIDTTRIFCTGFSFGAMFTYSLSTNHQKDFRAVAVYAGTNFNIYLPQNLHQPIAYFGTTGMSDGTCAYVASDANKTGGKYCALGHAEDNGCAIPSAIPTAKVGSLSHVSYNFEGCKAYPVMMCTFDGGHGCGPMDGRSGDHTTESWVPIETWKFFTQF
jgi:poly(3-hydroxybutyrate) depolymerase